MNRRNFLSKVGLVGGVLALPATVTATPSIVTNPTSEYGIWHIYYSLSVTKDAWNKRFISLKNTKQFKQANFSQLDGMRKDLGDFITARYRCNYFGERYPKPEILSREIPGIPYAISDQFANLTPSNQWFKPTRYCQPLYAHWAEEIDGSHWMIKRYDYRAIYMIGIRVQPEKSNWNGELMPIYDSMQPTPLLKSAGIYV